MTAKSKKKSASIQKNAAAPAEAAMAKAALEKAALEKAVTHGERFIMRGELLNITGLSYPCIWQKMKAADFPKPRLIGKRRVGWLQSEVYAWVASRPVQQYLDEVAS